MRSNKIFDSISAVPTLNAFSVYPQGLETAGLLYPQKLDGILKKFDHKFFGSNDNEEAQDLLHKALA